VVDERYECLKQIGHGAYGVVCSGNDLIKNKKVAVKKVGINFYVDLKCFRRFSGCKKNCEGD